MNSLKDKLVFDSPYEMLSYVSRMVGQAEAYNKTSERLNDAHDYVQRNLIPNGIGWGTNVWHAILDDAIRMRKELK